MDLGKQQRPWRLAEPYHDEEVIDESSAPTTTVITYKLTSKVVGTKTITVSGTTTTIKVVILWVTSMM